MAPKRRMNTKNVLPSSQAASPPSVEQTSSRSSTSSALSRSPSPHLQKRAKTLTDLTVDQETDMASWLEGHELIYNKKLNSYKDFRKKDALWEEKATEVHKTAAVLKTWYRSIRTRYTRLLRTKSGDAATELTERDRWILRSFGWLKSHVGEVRKKTTVSMKEKLAATQEHDGLRDEELELDSSANTSVHRLEPLTRNTPAAKRSNREEDRLLDEIVSRGEMSAAFQSKVVEMLKPPPQTPKTTERTAYADWAKEVMVGLHPTLWLKFQRECSSLLYTYQERNEDILHPAAHQQQLHSTQRPQQQQFPARQQQYQPCATNPSGNSATSAVWQPPPQQWPANVQSSQSVWGSQDSGWVHDHMSAPSGQHLTQLQPVQKATTTRRASVPATSSTPYHDGDHDSSFNLCSLVRDTVGLDASFTSVDCTQDN